MSVHTISCWALLAGLFLLGSCKSGLNEDLPEADRPKEKTVIRLNVSSKGQTKASSTDSYYIDDKINRATIYILEPESASSNTPGNVVGVVTSTSADQTVYEIETTIGPKFFYVVLNGTNVTNQATWSDLRNTEYNCLGTGMMNAYGSARSVGPLMTGLSAKTNVTSDTQELSVYVERKVFRVRLASLTSRLPENYSILQGYVFLSNAVPAFKYELGSVPGYYANSRGWIDGEGPIMGMAAASGVCSENDYMSAGFFSRLNYGESTSVLAYVPMYAFPNDCSTDSWVKGNTVSNWQADDEVERCTRVVIVCEYSSINESYGTSHYTYYPITLPFLDCNQTLDLSVVLYNLGTDSAETELTKGTVGLTVTVSDWTTTVSGYEF